MKVLVDTCIWSLALRLAKPQPDALVSELKELICSVAVTHNMPIFTCDKDFSFFQTVLPIRFHQIRQS